MYMVEKDEKRNDLVAIDDIKGKLVVDADGAIIGNVKEIYVSKDGEVKIQVEINKEGKPIVPKQLIPFSAVAGIKDVVLLNIKVNIKQKKK